MSSNNNQTFWLWELQISQLSLDLGRHLRHLDRKQTPTETLKTNLAFYMVLSVPAVPDFYIAWRICPSNQPLITDLKHADWEGREHETQETHPGLSVRGTLQLCGTAWKAGSELVKQHFTLQSWPCTSQLRGNFSYLTLTVQGATWTPAATCHSTPGTFLSVIQT